MSVISSHKSNQSQLSPYCAHSSNKVDCTGNVFDRVLTVSLNDTGIQNFLRISISMTSQNSLGIYQYHISNCYDDR